VNAAMQAASGLGRRANAAWSWTRLIVVRRVAR
jgi:hypothetical protein